MSDPVCVKLFSLISRMGGVKFKPYAGTLLPSWVKEPMDCGETLRSQEKLWSLLLSRTCIVGIFRIKSLNFSLMGTICSLIFVLQNIC